MIKERAIEWVAALRSGKYKQGNSTLRHNNTYCCLGVACDISGLREWGDQYHNKDQYEGQKNYPPISVRNHFGMNSGAGSFIDGSEIIIPATGDRKDPIIVGSLAEANDKGATFEEIANVIEQNWERL